VIVLDSSAAVEILLGVPRAAPLIRARLAVPGETVHVPHLFDLEGMAAVRRHALRGTLSTRRARMAVTALGELRASRYSHAPFRARVWELRENLTPYDAVFVSLAEALRAPLIRLDAALASAPGFRAEVELYP
jgi:predicted nucleic acid-binding protein